MQMPGKCVAESISPICVRRDYRVTVLHITKFAILSAVATPKHLGFFLFYSTCQTHTL